MKRFALLWMAACAACGAAPTDTGSGTTGASSLQPMCTPCAVDSDCGPAGSAICVDEAGGKFCAPVCSAATNCGAGASCQAASNSESVCYPVSDTCTNPGTPSTAAGSTGGSTAAGTSTGGTNGSSTTSGTTASGGGCPGFASPDTAANCPCGSGHTCSANGCYNGYWCDLSQNRCVAPPSQCASAATTGTTGVTSSSGTSTTGTAAAGSTTGGTGGHGAPYRVLFDAAHKQVAGNACWIVDSSQPDPQPSNPTSESSWSGGISAWGFDLYSSGRYTIAQLPSGAALTYGGGGAGDLSEFDVFVSDEPELQFASGEQSALMKFANAGGGIFLISDHSGAVRCSNCTEATQVIDDFLVSGPGSVFGARCDNNDVGSTGLNGTLTGKGPAVIGNGPFGSGSQLSYHDGSTLSASGNAQVVINSSSGGMMIASELSSGGRLVLVGDSSPEEDGTSSTCSATLHNGWGEADDRVLILNATAWLAHDGS